MGRVTGVKEKLHLPIYDAFYVDPNAKKTFEGTMTDPRMIRFFIDVQQKTKLETNLQASGMLPSMNTFEARAMRVIISPPKFLAVESGVAPTAEQVLSDLIYHSVSTLLVGEKVMIEMPTYYFPAGAGVSPSANHGDPDPLATFRFAEPVMIEPQQNFRVEMLFPHGVPGSPDSSRGLADVTGPFWVWVVLDGYYTRDVQ